MNLMVPESQQGRHDDNETVALFARLGQRALAGHADEGKRTPLHDAVANCAPLEVISALLDAAPYPSPDVARAAASVVDVSRFDRQQETPLALALSRPTPLPVIELLIARAPPGAALALREGTLDLLRCALDNDFGENAVRVVKALLNSCAPEMLRDAFSKAKIAQSALLAAARSTGNARFAPALVEVSLEWRP
jgi:hypothetical protein